MMCTIRHDTCACARKRSRKGREVEGIVRLCMWVRIRWRLHRYMDREIPLSF